MEGRPKDVAGLLRAWGQGDKQALDAVSSSDAGGGHGVPLQETPTLIAATKSGMIIGTVAYMSPEQAKAKPVDRRANIWAFGCVLYEMLAGQQVFGGELAPVTP